MTHHVAFESEDKSSSGETNATQKGKPRKDARRDRGVLEQGSPSSDDVLFPDGIALMPASNLTALLKPAVTGDESEEDHDSGCWGYSAVRLLPADSAPSWTVRPYIHSGYRGVLTLRQALSSVSYCHNETGNVVTHLLGLLIFMGLLVRDLFFRGLPAHHRILACSYLLVAQICMGMSTAYHLLGPISKRGFDIALRCDITGIALSIICSFMIGLHYGFWCHERIGNIYLIIVGTLSVVALVWPHIPALMGNWNATIIFYGSFVGFCPVPIIHWLVLVGGPVRYLIIHGALGAIRVHVAQKRIAYAMCLCKVLTHAYALQCFVDGRILVYA